MLPQIRLKGQKQEMRTEEKEALTETLTTNNIILTMQRAHLNLSEALFFFSALEIRTQAPLTHQYPFPTKLQLEKEFSKLLGLFISKSHCV